MRLSFLKMGQPVGNIDTIIEGTMNYSTTATLSVIDGVGIFGGRYRKVYYFEKNPETYISSTNTVTLNLFGVAAESSLDRFRALLEKLGFGNFFDATG